MVAAIKNPSPSHYNDWPNTLGVRTIILIRDLTDLLDSGMLTMKNGAPLSFVSKGRYRPIALALCSGLV